MIGSHMGEGCCEKSPREVQTSRMPKCQSANSVLVASWSIEVWLPRLHCRSMYPTSGLFTATARLQQRAHAPSLPKVGHYREAKYCNQRMVQKGKDFLSSVTPARVTLVRATCNVRSCPRAARFFNPASVTFVPISDSAV